VARIKNIRSPEALELAIYTALKDFASGESYYNFSHFEFGIVPDSGGRFSVRLFDAEACTITWLSLNETREACLQTIVLNLEEIVVGLLNKGGEV
jgi:hypothetical protein